MKSLVLGAIVLSLSLASSVALAADYGTEASGLIITDRAKAGAGPGRGSIGSASTAVPSRAESSASEQLQQATTSRAKSDRLKQAESSKLDAEAMKKEEQAKQDLLKAERSKISE